MPEHSINTQPKENILLYGIALGIFAILLALRENTSYSHIYDVLPVMGRTLPYIVLTSLLVIAFKMNGHHVRNIGLRLPDWNVSKSKMVMLIIGAALLILIARFVTAIPVSLLMNHMDIPASRLGQTGQLSGNLPLLLMILPVMWMAVVSEELLIRGFLMNTLARVFGDTRKGWIYAIIGSAIIFGIGHFPQGIRGVIGAGVGGLVYGTAYYLVGRSLVPGIIAHAGVNTVGFIAAYSEV
ncbi:CPBP family intramembrane glutamic endopeptidase [Kordiimonas laminariae]|uniref:CPBP family intramembrane glutamic endopeptidase n=1 Tax=Kordiimonas laminariae TaxID=2917717 RepID=UPI001FF18FC2|nr:CPBP family intramembrane glutamic endopeptidase [Kordiimonas laminariae]MCK0070294.1 CPBP family intramembrane metalloprotease [Kordiimonas laminariae]